MHWQVVDGNGAIRRLRRARRSTPVLLQVAGTAVLVAALLAGVLGGLGLDRRADALERARSETAQQVKLQTARTALVIADTQAGTDVLTGADPELFSSRLFVYEARPAVLGLVTAARTDADAATLATANSALSRYLMQVESARTLARTGRDQQATSTLAAASQILRDEVLPRLAEVQQNSQDRLAADNSAADLWPLVGVLVTLLMVLLLIGVHGWLTRRTHRWLNLGLVAGIVVLIVVTVAGSLTVLDSRNQVVQAQEQALTVADAVVEARISAFDARSGEALAVLEGTTTKSQKAWGESIDDADTQLQLAAAGQSAAIAAEVAEVVDDLQVYQKVHAKLLAAAAAGNTAKEQRIAVGPAEDGSVGSFEAFDAYSGALLARQVQAADDAWAAAGSNLRAVSWVTLAVGLLAAALCWSGIAARRREYR